jgi:hypothetical protein
LREGTALARLLMSWTVPACVQAATVKEMH